MPLGKRTFGTYKSNSARVYRNRIAYSKRVKRARKLGTTGYAGILRASVRAMAPKVNQLYSMIETKETTQTSGTNIGLPHNNVHIVQSGGAPLNIFKTYIGAQDPMAGVGERVGDKVCIRGVKIVAFMENALERTKVWYRMMLVRCPRGVTPDRTNLFKNDSGNKMIDQVNTERFTIVWQQQFSVSVANGAANTIVGVSGAPIQTITSGGQGTRVVKAWIPGRKFGRGGNIQYENGGVEVKFYDYRLVIVAYDWFGTPQDTNNVGKINELYTKAYYKDA